MRHSMLRSWKKMLWLTFFTFLLLALSGIAPLSRAVAGEPKESKWVGVDESVVEKYAKEHGREARTPFINTDQGDLLLFVFLVAGAIGGFVGGYYWRVLITENTAMDRRKELKHPPHETRL